MNTENKNEDTLIIYQAADGKVELRVDIQQDTIWATRIQLAQVFETTPQNISLHLGNIYTEGELDENSTRKKSFLVQKEGGRTTKRTIDTYNLDAIIAVGYRVNSKKATLFRIWATGVLREYLKNGYALQKSKLQESPEALEGINETLTLLKSEKYPGKLKGKITLKIMKNLEMKKK